MHQPWNRLGIQVLFCFCPESRSRLFLPGPQRLRWVSRLLALLGAFHLVAGVEVLSVGQGRLWVDLQACSSEVSSTALVAASELLAQELQLLDLQEDCLATLYLSPPSPPPFSIYIQRLLFILASEAFEVADLHRPPLLSPLSFLRLLHFGVLRLVHWVLILLLEAHCFQVYLLILEHCLLLEALAVLENRRLVV